MQIEKQHEYTPSSADAITKAENDNMLVKFPLENQLFIDIDSHEAYLKHVELRQILSTYLSFIIKETMSKSGGDHRHIILTFTEPMSIWQRMALQAALGSDIKRELLGCLMVMNNDPHPTLFVERQDTLPDNDMGVLR